MADKPPDEQHFDIPVPQFPSDDSQAVKENTDFDKEFLLRSERLDWWLRRRLKIALFVFVLAINVIWSYEVIRMLWSSGLAGTTFRLSDSVLIALVTTSIANFLGLVVIVARHLFPSDSSK